MRLHHGRVYLLVDCDVACTLDAHGHLNLLRHRRHNTADAAQAAGYSNMGGASVAGMADLYRPLLTKANKSCGTDP